MATRSLIGLQLPDGKILSVYCHNDGYLSWNGRILRGSYITVEQVEALLRLGNLSVLEETLEACYAYGRNRGDEGQEAEVTENRKAFIESGSWVNYLYLFRNGEWFYRNTTNHRNFRRLNEVVFTLTSN